jgi:hypothetical protein
MKRYVLSFRAVVGCTYRVWANTADEAIDHLTGEVDGKRWSKVDVDLDGEDHIELADSEVDVSEDWDF